MHGLAVYHLPEGAGEEHRAVQTAVEGAQVVQTLVFDLDATQHLVPALASGLAHIVERAVANLSEVDFSLLGADE